MMGSLSVLGREISSVAMAGDFMALALRERERDMCRQFLKRAKFYNLFSIEIKVRSPFPDCCVGAKGSLSLPPVR